MSEKPNAPSCERNKHAILKMLELYCKGPHHLLEVGSGTGQHGAYMAPRLPQVTWTPTDVDFNLPGIRLWRNESGAPNFKEPISFELGKDSFPKGDFNSVFSANVIHIISWELVETLIGHCGECLKSGSMVFFYGPFNYERQYTSPSNEAFDQWLKERDPASAIRDFELVVKTMKASGFTLKADHEMPANNRFLVFVK